MSKDLHRFYLLTFLKQLSIFKTVLIPEPEQKFRPFQGSNVIYCSHLVILIQILYYCFSLINLFQLFTKDKKISIVYK